MLDERGRALLIKVSSASADQAENAAQMLLLADERKPLGQDENTLLEEFLRELNLPPDQKIETLVIFPNIPQKRVLAGRLERKPGEAHWVGKERFNQTPAQY